MYFKSFVIYSLDVLEFRVFKNQFSRLTLYIELAKKFNRVFCNILKNQTNFLANSKLLYFITWIASVLADLNLTSCFVKGNV